MPVVDRYLFKTVVVSTALVLLALLVLEVLFVTIGELEDLGEGGYDLRQIGLFVGLSLPGLIYQTLPAALLVGGLLGVGGLAAGNELMALQAAGWSPLRLTAGALLAALTFGVVVLLLGEWVIPDSERLARQVRLTAKSGGQVQAAAGGLWARDGRQVVRVGAFLTDGTVADLTLYAFDAGSRLLAVRQAARGRFLNPGWLLDEVRETRFGADGARTGEYRQLRWQSALQPQTLALLAAEPQHLALSRLVGYIDYLQANGLDARQYQLAFWAKLATPLTCVAMLLIGVPFAFGRSRVAGAGQRLLLGVLLGLLFFLLNRMLGNWVLLAGMPPAFGALAPTLLFLLAGLLPLQRTR